MKPIYPLLFVTVAILFGCEEKPETYDALAQFQADLKLIDEYVATSGLIVLKDPSGVSIAVTSLGSDGMPPKRYHKVKVNYRATLLDGETIEEGTFEDLLTSFIAGGVEGLEILPEGSEAKLIIPSALAYGPDGRLGVPPNSILVYDVQLEEVSPPQEEVIQFKLDTAGINKYLKDNEIDAVEGPYGLRYVITKAGTGSSIANWYSQIRVHYTGRLMSTNEAFFIGTVGPTDDFQSRVVDFLPGLQIAFQSFPPGTEATIYIPSTLAFGPEAVGGEKIPANSNLIYEVDNFEVVKF